MKLIKYFLYSSLAFCGCSDAAPKTKIPELTCPYILPAEKDFPDAWVTLGKMSPGQYQLRAIGLIDGNAAQEKQRVLEIKERMFTEEMFDEWTKLKDRSELLAEYDEDHAENSMKCIYGRTQEESFDEKSNVILLIPLPVKKALSCLLVRRDVDPTHEISCKVK